ncbi:MAG TPA: YjgN family protein [Myxococcota bacterium]
MTEPVETALRTDAQRTLASELRPPGDRLDRPFRFTGSAGEFFRIWIVNLCLCILTLGLYTPWAKVRTRRYLYANLELAGSSFHYDADPMRILIGRLIVLAALGFYSIAESLSPVASIPLAIAYALAFPLAAVRSTAFHHRHSLYRNIRFRFAASYREAFHVILVGPLLSLLSLGLAHPWWQGRRQAFVVSNSRYGTTGFAFDWRASPYYAVWVQAGLVWILGVSLVAVAMALLLNERLPLLGAGEGIPFATTFGWIAFLVPLALAYGLVQAGITNLLYGQAGLGALRFRSTLRAWPLAGLYVSNVAAIICSFGLLVPWARIRMLRHRADHLALVGAGDLGEFVQAVEAASTLDGVASEAADAFDFDLGL